VGVGLAVAYYAAFLWFQVLVTKRSSALTPALTVVGFVVRLALFAVILFLLAYYSPLNIIAVGVAFAVLYTVLSIWGISVRLKLAKRADSVSTGTEGARKPGVGSVNGPKGA
jgi:hypothetical protein